MYRILEILSPEEVAECKKIAADAPFVDGKITNPHMMSKNNEQLHDQAANQRSSELLRNALLRSPEFMEFAFPVALAPPLITRYQPGMHYGAHADAAFIQLPGATIRSDLSCTIFLNDPDSYDGGELWVQHSDGEFKFKLQPGQAIVYPSTSFHQVLPVTRGERLVAITFIQSRIKDPFKRSILFDLNEVAALEGLKMEPSNYSRLQLVQQNSTARVERYALAGRKRSRWCGRHRHMFGHDPPLAVFLTLINLREAHRDGRPHGTCLDGETADTAVDEGIGADQLDLSVGNLKAIWLH